MTAAATAFAYEFGVSRADAGASAATVLALHKTGDGIDATIALARRIFPRALIVAPRGDVMDGDRRRFFARHADGSFDAADWQRAGVAMASFTRDLWQRERWPRPILFGLSHGANTALAAMVADATAFAGAALLRPAPLPVGSRLPDLAVLPVLVAWGRRDPTVPPAAAETVIAALAAAGADLAAFAVDSTHQLAPEDIAIAATWARERQW